MGELSMDSDLSFMGRREKVLWLRVVLFSIRGGWTLMRELKAAASTRNCFQDSEAKDRGTVSGNQPPKPNLKRFTFSQGQTQWQGRMRNKEALENNAQLPTPGS